MKSESSLITVRLLSKHKLLVDGGGQNVITRRRCAEIRLYSGADNIEVSRQVLDGEFIVMTSLCSAFYILYTSRGQLHIFSTLTTQVVSY